MRCNNINCDSKMQIRLLFFILTTVCVTYPPKSMTTYIEDEVKRIKDDPLLTSADVKTELIKNLDDYIKNHNALYGIYKGYVPPAQPVNDTDIFKSFSECLKSYELELASIPFKFIMAHMTGMDLSKVPCTYGMMTISPNLATFIKEDINRSNSTHGMLSSLFLVPKKGMAHLSREAIFKAVRDRYVEDEKHVFAFQKKTTVNSSCCLTYTKDYLDKKHKDYEKHFVECFDFCVVTADLRSMNFTEFGTEESAIFGALDRFYAYQYITSTTKNNSTKSMNHREFYLDSGDLQYCDNRDAWYSPSQLYDNSQTSLCFQVSLSKNETADHINLLTNLRALGYETTEASKAYIKRERNYLGTRFNSEKMAEGIYQKIFKMQGNNTMWYLGQGVTCASMECRLAYNDLVWSKYPKATTNAPI